MYWRIVSATYCVLGHPEPGLHSGVGFFWGGGELLFGFFFFVTGFLCVALAVLELTL